ncbi:MAG: hypothetical protein QOJ72_528 [Nocardioidaceae bacterium]|jgi:alpha-tubulin suppressor-like RCC1 family protein|nr:hypothetical protein [Nocardioidaceae bacterium]
MRVLLRLLAATVVAIGSLVTVSGSAQASTPEWNSIATGGQHACGIRTGGSLYCWGANSFGQVGDGSTSPRTSPRRIGTSHWLSVAAGRVSTCGIRSDRLLYCWGYNGFGGVGDGTTVDRTTPRRVGSAHWLQVTVGQSGTCGITTSHKLYCWGNNDEGELATGDDRLFTPVPRRVGTSSSWTHVTAGFFHLCATTDSHRLYCWGYDAFGQVGIGADIASVAPPTVRTVTRVGTKSDWTMAAAGGEGSCGLRTGGRAFCWGSNADGRIGDGTTDDRSAPVQAGEDFAEWSTIATGDNHTCAVSTHHALDCWGLNFVGQLGVGDTATRVTPAREDRGFGDWKTVAVGDSFSCGLRSNKQLYCWGLNDLGQLGVGSTTNHLAPTRIG